MPRATSLKILLSSVRRERAAPGQARVEVLAFEQLHRDVGHAALGAVVEDLHHVRAAHRRGRARLLDEAVAHLRDRRSAPFRGT